MPRRTSLNLKNAAIAAQDMLIAAVKNDDSEGIQLAISLNANVNAADENGTTPLHLAPNAQVLAQLLAAGADADAKDKQDMTVLQLRLNDPKSIDVLGTAGAEVNLFADPAANTLLHRAASQKDSALMLIKHGADRAVMNIGGMNPADTAVENQQYALARELTCKNKL
jgi:ankyrin repeat protein